MAGFTDERVNAILRGPRAFRVVTFPGTEGDGAVPIAVRLLTDREVDLARVQAQADLRALSATRQWDPVTWADIDPEHFDRLVSRQVVWAAYYDPATIAQPTPARFFPTPTDVGSLDATTVERLMRLYLEHQEFVAPLRKADEKEVTAILDALGKGLGSSALLDAFERSTLVRLCLSLASLLRSSSPTNKSPTG